MIIFIMSMSAVGFMAGYDGGTFLDGVLTLWFYSALAACLLGLVMPVIFSDRYRAINYTAAEFGASSASHFVGDRMAAAYADSDYDLMSNEIYWPQSDYHKSAVSSDSFDINPATGQTMVGMYDTSGCLYGYSDPVFTDNNHTNQFSDFDYHNNQ